jgi:hypothetical protein
MKKAIVSALIISFAIVGLMAYGFKAGNGRVISQNRPVSGFHALDITGAASVTVRQSSTYSCIVSLDENLQDQFETVVRNGVLHVGFRPGTSVSRVSTIKVDISMPSVDSIHGSGAVNVSLGRGFSGKSLDLNFSGSSDFSADTNQDFLGLNASGASHLKLNGNFKEINAEISGASSFSLSGKTSLLSARVNGGSKIDAWGLSSDSVKLQVSGASSIDLGTVARVIKASLSGASQVRYDGNPTVDSDSSGASSIKHR